MRGAKELTAKKIPRSVGCMLRRVNGACRADALGPRGWVRVASGSNTAHEKGSGALRASAKWLRRAAHEMLEWQGQEAIHASSANAASISQDWVGRPAGLPWRWWCAARRWLGLYGRRASLCILPGGCTHGAVRCGSERGRKRLRLKRGGGGWWAAGGRQQAGTELRTERTWLLPATQCRGGGGG